MWSVPLASVWEQAIKGSGSALIETGPRPYRLLLKTNRLCICVSLALWLWRAERSRVWLKNKTTNCFPASSSSCYILSTIATTHPVHHHILQKHINCHWLIIFNSSSDCSAGRIHYEEYIMVLIVTAHSKYVQCKVFCTFCVMYGKCQHFVTLRGKAETVNLSSLAQRRKRWLCFIKPSCWFTQYFTVTHIYTLISYWIYLKKFHFRKIFWCVWTWDLCVN